MIPLPKYCEEAEGCNRLVSMAVVVEPKTRRDHWLFTCDWHCGNGPWARTLADWKRQKGIDW